jgi:uncharacterized membrane protein YdjX (TVP38/TMEM64 family)
LPNPSTHSSIRIRKSTGIRFAIAGLGIGLFAIGGLGLMFGLDGALEKIISAISALWSALKAAPAPIYFGIMAIALVAPVPASVFYITAGPLYGIALSLAWIAPALALNALLVHMLAHSMLRPPLERLVARTGRALPEMGAHRDQNLFILLVRITPGIPYFLQSWVIALSGVRRTPFILLSVATQMLYAAGFVILGRSAFAGRAGLAVSAVALLVVASIIARMAHGRLKAGVAEHETPVSK